MNTKRFIAGALSAAVLIPSSLGLALLTPVIAYAAPHRAESASEISVSDSEISIHTDQISREAAKSIELETGDSWEYDKRARTYKCAAGKTKYCLSYNFSTYALDKQTLSITLRVTNSSITDTAEKIVELVTLSTPSGNNIYSCTAEKDTKKSTPQTVFYTVKASFISYYGNSFVALNFDSKLKDHELTISNCTVSADNVGCMYSTVTDNKGQKLHMDLKKNSGFSDSKYNNWLRNLGRYTSSLSAITDIKYEDIYISFDDPSVQQPTSCCDYVVNESGQSVGVLIKFQPDTSGFILEQVMNGLFDWGIMHEISHAYSHLNGNNKSYEQFNTTGDEGLVNVRGITAIQNCSELRNINIGINGIDLGSYKHAMKNSADVYGSNGLFDQLYIYDKYANSFREGWNVLEKITHGADSGISSEALNGAIQFISESGKYTYGGWGSNSICFSTRDTLRFINVLYFLSTNHPEYGTSKDKFKKFLNDYVGIDIFAHYYRERTNNDNYYNQSIIYSDVNGDRVFNENDLLALKSFVAGKSALAPEGVYQADYNGDGCVNEQDAVDMEEMWF